MLATELINIIQNNFFKKFFNGIFSADNLPTKLKNNHFIIVNTDVHSGPGKHWYAVVRRDDTIECFDSIGVTEEQKQFLSSHFNFKGISHLTFNTSQLQPLSSTLCGQYALYFLFERYHNFDWDFDDLLNEMFSENLDKNAQVVSKFMNNLGINGDRN